ncbi:hypothetical protein EVAR_62412_1 [Eumeta japonica]|uniref:Uncharacterized protein n=1 Tax=Eumeta variegata TaxID=151549 RepID=A0A4C1Z8F3_EUMVA|nr:hypothetical protein EVAR_62412_1 [Eumeta japonica]
MNRYDHQTYIFQRDQNRGVLGTNEFAIRLSAISAHYNARNSAALNCLRTIKCAGLTFPDYFSFFFFIPSSDEEEAKMSCTPSRPYAWVVWTETH